MVTIPLVKFLEKFRIPQVASVFLVLILLVGCLVFIGMVLYRSGLTLITLYPKYEARITEIYIQVARIFDLPYDEHLSIFDNIWGQVGVRNRVRVMTLSFSNAFISFLRDAFMVAIFLAFILFEAAFFREKLDKAFEGARAGQIKKISTDVMTQITRYLSIKFFFSVANGIIIGIGFTIIGVEFAVIWAVLQFIGNFIPNFGSVAVGLAATAFSLLQFWPNPTPVIATAILVLGMNIVLSYLLEPKIMGDNLGLSPLIVLVSLLIWGWIWGFTGLIIAVPMFVIIKIVCENIPVLEPISIIMGAHKAAMAVKPEEEESKVPL
jgi:predicted PurR-regulated permease PerM